MPALQFHKVVSALPDPLEANAVYFVRVGTGVKAYITNDLGEVASYPIQSDSANGLFMLWVEENGAASTGTASGYQWSWGNGAEPTVGLCLPVGCFLLATTFASDGGTSGLSVEIHQNGVAAHTSTYTSDPEVESLGVPIAFNAGDVINVRTIAGSGGTSTRIGFLMSAGTAIDTSTMLGSLSDVNVASGSEGDVLTQQADGSYAMAAPSGGGSTDIDTVAAIAKGAALGLEQSLLASAGQPGRTVLAVGYTNTGKVQGISLADGNVVEVYASGAQFNAGNVLYREFMSLGEPIVFTGLSNGAIITSTGGFYGCSDQLSGSNESPMPLLSFGLAFTNTFAYGFRNSNYGDGYFRIVNGPLPSKVTLYNNTGSVVRSQQDIELDAWEYMPFDMDGNNEYQIVSDNPIMACVHARMSNNSFYDARLVMPVTSDGITWPRSGFVSAPYDNTAWDYYVRDGAKGSSSTSPGSPTDFDGVTGAGDQDYEPNGATRVLATGLISAYSGADSAGLEASPLMPTSAMSQVVAQPFEVTDSGDGGNSGVAIASPYEGTAYIYAWNFTTSQLELAYTVPLTRTNAAVTREDQNHPAAGLVANESSAVALVGTLNPGIVVADVPITVVTQSAAPGSQTYRSQGGATASAIAMDDDETLMLGHTPPEKAVEIREDANGLLRKRVIDSSGVETWVLA